ncbi:DUF1493 family protein [Acerihabitans arboris]|uniref:DUF1493 family protein n=1 Tax=Acerihabitans arboris TaxID=2691583 RepID=A0A845SMP4_9GAMM|nr:DUF1493 family protein [Acerihabitans arboris]NDL63891.1 DUF1493 family protein [Acerihabitans arboris]
MEPDLQQQVFDFIAPFRLPDIWGRRKPLCLAFSVRDDLGLSPDEFDHLMNDFFLLFQVDACHYDHLAYFPEDSSPMPIKIMRQLGRCIGSSAPPAPRPLTIELLVTAARAGRWPQRD